MPLFSRESTRALASGLNPLLDIRGVNASVRINGEDRGDVRIVVTARFWADSESDADALMNEVAQGLRSEGNRVHIHEPDQRHGSLDRGRGSFLGAVRQVSGRGRHSELEYTIATPLGASLDMNLVNGGVWVAGLGGGVEIDAVNGRLDFADLGGNLTCKCKNGRITIDRVRGSVQVRNRNGALDVKSCAGDLNLEHVNGRVTINDAGAGVSVRGVNGTFDLTGAVRGDITMSTTHGAIRLHLPPESRFQLDAESALGSVTSELAVRDGATGGGAVPRVRLRSETGSIELRKLHPDEPVAAFGVTANRD